MLRFHETPRQRVRLECLRLAVQRAQTDDTVLDLAKQFEAWVTEEPTAPLDASNAIPHSLRHERQISSATAVRGARFT